MDDPDENVLKKITLTREKASCILDVDPDASLREIKFAFKKTSYKIYPKTIETNKEDLLMFDLVSAAYKRLTSATSDDVYIDSEYPFKLFRKAFKEKRVITIQAQNGTFIVLGEKDEADKRSSDDEFDARHYSFVRGSRNGFALTSHPETMTKSEKNKLKKKKQKENKLQAKRELQKERDAIKIERRKASDNQAIKGPQNEISESKQKIKYLTSRPEKHCDAKRPPKNISNEMDHAVSKGKEITTQVSSIDKTKQSNFPRDDKTNSKSLTKLLPAQDLKHHQNDQASISNSVHERNHSQSSDDDDSVESDWSSQDEDCTVSKKENLSTKSLIKSTHEEVRPSSSADLTSRLQSSVRKSSRTEDVHDHYTTSKSQRLKDKSQKGSKAAVPNETVHKLALDGNINAERGKYNDAVSSFSAAIALDPSNCLLFANRSYCYEKLNDLKSALQDAEKAIRISSGWARGYLRKARVLVRLKKFADAEKAYERALTLDKFNQTAQKEISEVRIEQLVEMGFSRQKSLLAIERYPNVSIALENLLAGNLSDLVTDDIYVSDDEEIVDSGSATPYVNDHALLESSAVPKLSIPRFGSVLPRQEGKYNKTSSMRDNDHRSASSSTDVTAKPEYYAVWLGNVTRQLKVGMLRERFGKFGTIRSVRMHYEGKYAFVNYENPESAPLAVQGNDFIEICGMKLKMCLGPGCKGKPDKPTEETNT